MTAPTEWLLARCDSGWLIEEQRPGLTRKYAVTTRSEALRKLQELTGAKHPYVEAASGLPCMTEGEVEDGNTAVR